MSLVPTILERAMGEGTLTAAAALLAWLGVSALTALAARWLPSRVTPRPQLAAGLAGCAVGDTQISGSIAEPTSRPDVITNA